MLKDQGDMAEMRLKHSEIENGGGLVKGYQH